MLEGPGRFFAGGPLSRSAGSGRWPGCSTAPAATSTTRRARVLGLHAVGDSHTCTNPLYGRGCSLALVQALRLADAFAEPATTPGRGRWCTSGVPGRSSPGSTRRSRWTRRRRPGAGGARSDRPTRWPGCSSPPRPIPSSAGPHQHDEGPRPTGRARNDAAFGPGGGDLRRPRRLPPAAATGPTRDELLAAVARLGRLTPRAPTVAAGVSDGTICIEHTAATLGAIVTGVELRSMTDEQWVEIEAAFHEHAVLVFPDQHLTSSEQAALGRRFGGLSIEWLVFTNCAEDGSVLPPDDPLVRHLAGNEGWHTDSSFQARAAKASILSAHRVPSAGGATEWADIRAAYDALDGRAPPGPRDVGVPLAVLLAGPHRHRPVDHRVGRRQTRRPDERARGGRRGGPAAPTRQGPPRHGRPALFVGRHAYGVPGSTRPSRPRARQADRRGLSPPRVHRHQWQPGDIAVWDNRSLTGPGPTTPPRPLRGPHPRQRRGRDGTRRLVPAPRSDRALDSDEVEAASVPRADGEPRDAIGGYSGPVAGMLASRVAMLARYSGWVISRTRRGGRRRPPGRRPRPDRCRLLQRSANTCWRPAPRRSCGVAQLLRPVALAREDVRAHDPGHSTLTPTGGLGRQLDGERLADRHDAVLGGVVRPDARTGASPATDAVLTMWPPSAFQQVRQERLDAVDDAPQVDVDDPLPVPHRQLLDRGRRRRRRRCCTPGARRRSARSSRRRAPRRCRRRLTSVRTPIDAELLGRRGERAPARCRRPRRACPRRRSAPPSPCRCPTPRR